MSAVVQHQAVEVAKAALALEESTGNLKQAKEDYRKYEKDLKNLKGTLDQLETDYANGTPGVTQADIVELKQLIDDAEGDKEWYLAGIAAAAADVTSKTTLLVQQTQAGIESAASYSFGFNAGVQLDIDASKTQSESHQTSSVASTLSGQNIRIKTGSGNAGETTGNTLIQGSHLQADNQIAIDTGNLAITASQDTASAQTQTEHGHITVAQTFYGAAGGPSVNASLDRSQNRDRQTSYNNSTLNADNIRLTTSGDAELTGANVHANNQLDVDIAGDLNVESRQNRASGSNSSAGISGGLGTNEGDVSSVNGGFNSANGRYQTKETVLTSLTSGGQANIDVGGHTQITGALVATVDEEGKDLGNLNLSTGTLDYADLSNTDYSSQQSAGISTSVGLNGANSTDPAQQNAQDATGNDDLKLNTSNVQYSNSSHYDKSKTLATLGQGNVTVRDEESAKNGDLAGLNRDVENTEKELFEVDRQEGNVDVTVDHRLLSEDGLADIAGDIETIREASKETFTVLVSGAEKGLEITADIAKELGLIEGETYTPEQLEAMGIGVPSPRPLEDLGREWESLAPEQREAMAILNELQESLGEIETTGESIGEINWNAVQQIAWDLDNPEGGPVAALQTLKHHIMDNPRLDEEYDNAAQLRDATAHYFRKAEEFDNTVGMASNIASGGLITVVGKAGAKATAGVATTPATKKAHETLEDASPWLNKEQPKGGRTVGDTAKLDKPTQEMLDDPYHPDWNRYDGPEKMGVGADRVKNADDAPKYAPTAKHRKGGWGTEMDLDDNVAQGVLNRSVQGGKQRYGYHDGKLYEFQPDNQGGWHGYPIKGTEAPPSILKEMKERGDFSKSEYKRLIKGK